MDDIDRAAGVEHRCRRVLGMNVDPVEKAAQITLQLSISAEDADVVLGWVNHTEADRTAQNIRRAQLFAESKTLEALDSQPIHAVAREIDRLNTAGRRLRGEFFLGQVESANADVRKLLRSAIAEHVPQMSEHQYLNMSKKMSTAEFREITRQVYEIMMSQLNDNGPSDEI